MMRWWAMPAVAVCCVGLILTLMLWDHSVRGYRQQLESDFAARATTIERVMRQRIGVYSQALHSAAALFHAQGEVDRQSWRRFVSGMRLQENHPGLLAMAYARYVDDGELRAVIEQARRDGIAEYAMRPAGRRDRYVVNVYAEPFTEQNRRALGYDMYQDAERRRVMDLARDTARPQITAKVNIKIDTEPNPRPAFIMYLPVYRGGMPTTVQERRERLAGFVLCPFRMPELMPAVLDELADDLGVAVYDGGREEEPALFFRNAAFDQERAPLLRRRAAIEVGGRTWTLAFASTREFEDDPGRYVPYAVLGIGLAVTLSLSAMLFSMAAARRRAVVLADRMTESLRASEAKWHSLYSQAPLGVVLLDRAGKIIECNQAMADIAGVAREDLVGFNALEQARDPVLRPWLLRGLAGECVRFESAYRFTVGDARGHYRFHFQPIEQDGSFSVLLCFIEDITEQHLATERIATLAERDALTGLANRFLLNDRLEQMLLVEHRDHRRLAVLFLDLDHFKTINDSLGHTVGDAVLKEVARRISASVRETDTVARLGGDEFVVVLRDVESADSVAHIAEKIMAHITAPLTHADRRLDVTGSIGIAMYPGDGGDADTLIRNADTAMYHAKESGRNNFQFFTVDMNARVMEALAMEAAFKHALRAREFVLHYQPMVTVGDGRLVGMEALVRWERPGAGTVPPGSFIPMAEMRGLIGPLGEWVLQEACRQARAWQLQGLPPAPVSVNVSAVQLRGNTLVAAVRHALGESGLEPRWLELEITESALAHNIESAIAVVTELKALGIRIAIDDFGTGYSSLSYLKRFPIDKLKIDQSFVRDLTSHSDDAAITQAIIAMARQLGMRVIAEGVETAEQLDFLRRNQCDEAQGYLFSRPLAAEAMTRYLACREAGGQAVAT
ncbi:MAG TPA: EAL domain-containing protein [Paucimonas sp.]|nr:EAL domain-containing protein [Paucimonas sp.]